MMKIVCCANAFVLSAQQQAKLLHKHRQNRIVHGNKKNFPTYHKQGSLNHKFKVLL